MSHEITSTDNVVLFKDSAWHGLGNVVQHAMDPCQAAREASLDWEVEQWELVAKCPAWGEDGQPVDSYVPISDKVVNVRSDTREQLGVVGVNWKPYQNLELADFCMALAEEGDTVQVETAGSIRGGKKVWFLLRGESFSVRESDEVTPYICVSNGHDGLTALRCTPTTVRVVCSNTLHMVIPDRFDTGKLVEGSYVCHHTSNLKSRVEDAKETLKLYHRGLEGTKKVAGTLAGKDVSGEAMRQFFLDCYQRDHGGIPVSPATKVEENRRNRAMDAYRLFENRFESEKDIAGTTAWNAFNAYSGWLLNDKPSRLKDKRKAVELKLESKLFGADSRRVHDTLTAALSL